MFPTDVVVLGPQRLEPTVRAAAHEITGASDADRMNYAVVTAGWEERESEDAELSDHLGGRMTNLKLFERAEEVFASDPELLEAMLAHNERLKKLQKLYRVRLSHALDAARTLLQDRVDDDAELLEIERDQAIEDVRRLDAQHLERLRQMYREFQDKWRPHQRPSVAKHRAAIEGVLANCNTVCIAGGHVLILLNRLRMFGLTSLVGDRPILCWSAGAMALSDRVIVFHDSPPQGPGNAEVLQAGVGLFEGLVPLPHAKRRLRLDDPVRVGLFARRFGPSICAVLDEGTRVHWDGRRWKAALGTKRLREDGSLEELAT